MPPENEPAEYTPAEFCAELFSAVDGGETAAAIQRAVQDVGQRALDAGQPGIVVIELHLTPVPAEPGERPSVSMRSRVSAGSETTHH